MTDVEDADRLAEVDLLSLRGDRGLLFLDRYRTTPDPFDLEVAVEELTAATGATEHEDWPLWCYALATALLLRIDGLPDEAPPAATVALAERAAGWMEHANGRAHPALFQPGLAVELGELYWDLYAQNREEPDAALQLDHLIHRLRRLRAPQEQTQCHAAIRVMLGAAHEERFRRAGEADDLDLAIAYLDPAIDQVPDHAVPVTDAYLSLTRALLERSTQDNGPVATLNRLVEITGAGAARSDPGDPGRLSLLRAHYLALDQRFERVGDHFDRDRAIEALTEVVTAPDPAGVDGDDAMMLGTTLASRGGDYEAGGDLLAAAHWFGVAADRAGGDDELRWLALIERADAFRVHADLTGGVEHLPALVEALDRALAVAVLDQNHVLLAHLWRLDASWTLAGHQGRSGQRGPAELAPGLREFAERAHAALAACADADGDLRAAVAVCAAANLIAASARDEQWRDARMIRELLDVGRGGQLQDPDFQQAVAVLSGPGQLVEAMRDHTGRTDFGAQPLAETLTRLPETARTAGLTSLVAMLRHLRGHHLGDRREIRRSTDDLRRMRDRAGPTDADEDVTLLVFLAELAALGRTRNTAAASDLARELRDRLPQLGGEAPSMAHLDAMLRALIALSEIAAGRVPDLVPVPPPMPDDAILTGIVGPIPGIFARMANAATLAIRGEEDGVGAAIADLISGVESASPAQRGPALLTAGAMAAHLVLHLRPGERGLLERGIVWAEAAVGALDPGDQIWVFATTQLGHLRRLRSAPGDRERSRRLGLDMLRGYAWQVLLQSDVESGLAAAALATTDAATVAAWCLDDADADADADDDDDADDVHGDAYDTVGATGAERQRILADLVRVLDAGRALVLQASTATGRVHDALIAHGRPELARAWPAEAATGRASREAVLGDLATLLAPTSGLRNEVVRTLTAAGTGAALLDPPDPSTVAAALTGHGSDALVYLVGGPGADRGYAVVVWRSGGIELIDLPGLTAAEPLHSYLRTHHLAAGRSGQAGWTAELGRLCDWAWTAAMAPILSRCAQAGGGDRVPGLVLVPAGPLGIVPWPAARREVDGTYRYAVQDARVSVAASARLWCDVVGRPWPPTGTALILANPDGDLASAQSEAVAIHEAFYPDAVYLGQPADRAQGAGTAAELIAWLEAQDGEAGRVLHVATHGWVEVERPAESALRMADGALRAGELVERLAHRARPLGTVVLASCTTNLAGRAYDEALSLSTAFLVAGARAVIGSLWSVPSSSTGVLMFMFHHFLRRTPDRPGEALRQAQLWMLDPDRRRPPQMPDALSVPPEWLPDPYRWAGFSHLGR